MILRQLVVHNFGPFYGRVEIDLAPSEDDAVGRPIVLFGALNGGGKTSLLDALTLALYGKRARCSKRGATAYPEFLRSCINRRVAPSDGASVELAFDFATADGVSKLRVVRSWRDTGSAVAEAMAVNRDGMYDPNLTDSWDQRVEDLLPLGLSNLFFFDGEQVRSLATDESTTEEVREAIRTLLGLELPKRLRQDLDVIERRKRKAQASAVTLAAVSALEDRVAEVEKEHQDAEDVVTQLKVALAHANSELERVRGRFAAQGGETATEREALEAQRQKAIRQAEGVKERMRGLAEGALPFGAVAGLLGRALVRAEQEVQQAERAGSLQLLVERDTALIEHLRTKGHDPVLALAAKDFLDADRAKRTTPLQGAPYLQATRDALTLMHNVHDEQLPGAVEDAKRAFKQLKAARREERRLEGLLETSAAPEDLQSLLTEVETASREVERVQAEITRWMNRIEACARARRELDDALNRALSKAMNEREEQLVLERVLKASDRVRQVLDAYESRLKTHKLTDLERFVTERFRHLARKEDLVERIEIDAETFDLDLYDADGQPIDRRRLSAGEQQLLAVAFLWGLAEASGRSLPVVIDTPLSRMDSEHRTNLVERYFPQVSHQVVLLSTDVEIDQGYHKKLQELDVIERSYLIEYDPAARRSSLRAGYFWPEA